MRFSFSLVVVLFVIAPAMAQSCDSAKARAQAALALTSLERRAPADAACAAKSKAALLLAQRQREREVCFDDFEAAAAKAAKENKWLFVWVGMTCHDAPHVRSAFPGVLHCHADGFAGDKTQRLVVGPLNNGSFKSFPRATVDSEGSPKQIRSEVEGRPVPMSFAPAARATASC